MNEEVKKTLWAIYKTLNEIDVKGRKNLDGMLACLMALEDILKEESE